MMRSIFTLLIAACLAAVAEAQPSVLLHSINAPPTGTQTGGQFGYRAAVDGNYIVVGAPNDGTDGVSCGLVQVYNATTKALLYTLHNPSPADYDFFGISVAISGTRVVVGASQDDTGVTDSGSAYVYNLSSGTPTVPVATLNNPTPGASDQFGSSVSISGTRVVVGAYRDDASFLDTGRAYVYDLTSGTPAVPVVTLSDPTPAAEEFFGCAVAVSGTLVAVGVSGDDAEALDAGRVYVFDVGSGTPTVPAFTLKNPSPGEGDNFGLAVAIAGTRVVVGTPLDTAAPNGSGSAYVFDLDNGSPAAPVAVLTNPSPGAGDQFGCSVAISGTRIVVGAFQDDTGAADAGRAYSYDLTSETPAVPVVTLNNPTPAAGDRFGACVGISGSVMVAGAPFDDTAASDAGSLYVYDLASGTPATPTATLNNPGLSTGDNFGTSVAISGTRMVVGSPSDPTGAVRAGSAYVYQLGGATPNAPLLTINNPSPAIGDSFGWSVGISGNYVVVGAPENDGSKGSAYIYNLASATPTVPLFTLNNPTGATFEYFGRAVAISGTKVVVGAYGATIGAAGLAGIAYVYDISGGTPTVPLRTLNNPTPEFNDGFGISVAISGSRVVVGAFQDRTGANKSGSAYVYDLSGVTPTFPVVTLNNPTPAVNDHFGVAVGISGTRVVVGAQWDDTGAADAGSAYVYDMGTATPSVPLATLNNPSPAVGDNFGYSVAISGARVVVGALEDDTGANGAGSAYVYDVGGSSPDVPVAVLNNPAPGPADSDQFGAAVAIDGALIAVGTPYDDTVSTDKGSAYVFEVQTDRDDDGLLDSWELAYWPTTAGHGPLDDYDHDGYVELMEQALGLDPTQVNLAGLPAAVPEEGYLTITLTKQRGILYEIQSAGTLLLNQPNSFSASTTTTLINDSTTLKVRDNVPIGTQPARFMRVKVTAAP